MRIVLHLDMDAFFASVEERDNPRFRGRPIVIGSDPNSPAGEGKGRGVVSTANYKARAFGIHSAQPISTSWRLAEEHRKKTGERTLFLGVHMKRYREVSEKIMLYLKTQAEKFEQASVDEAYLQLGELETLNPKSETLNKSKIEKSEKDMWELAGKKAKEIKAHIKKEFGLTCSIGIGPNKLIAKIASDEKKPDGLTIIKPDSPAGGVQKFLDAKSVRVIPGIGPKSAAELVRMGVKTIQELRAFSEDELTAQFGKWGKDMYDRARGINDSPVQSGREVKSIGEQQTLMKDTLDARIILKHMKALADAVYERVRHADMRFKGVTITVRFSDFKTVTRSTTLAKHICDRKALETTALQLLLPFFDTRENPRRKAIRLIGVRVEKLLMKKVLVS